jgi:hypothetical protein
MAWDATDFDVMLREATEGSTKPCAAQAWCAKDFN